MDFITGIIAAKKQKQAITSSGMKTTIGKVFLYETAVCMAFLVQQYLTGDTLPALKIVAALIGITELKSILENLDRISGDQVFKLLLARVLQSEQEYKPKRKGSKKKDD